jgi:hypothetical protein
MPRHSLWPTLALALFSAGCSGGGGESPTATTSPELSGSVVPLYKFSQIGALASAPKSDTEDLATLGPDSTSFIAWTETRNAETSGDDGIRGSGSSRSTMSQASDFTSTGAGRVSAWTVAHSGSASATSNFGTSLTIPSDSSGRSQFVFHFRVDEPGLVLAVEGGHRLEGDSAALDVSIVEVSLDGSSRSRVFEIDLWETDVDGPGAVNETLVSARGLRVRTRRARASRRLRPGPGGPPARRPEGVGVGVDPGILDREGAGGVRPSRTKRGESRSAATDVDQAIRNRIET